MSLCAGITQQGYKRPNRPPIKRKEYFLQFCKKNRIELLLGGIALLLYVPGVGWGWPSGTGPGNVRPWGHDDVMPLGALTEMQNTFLQPEPNRYLGYPLMQYLLVAIAYGPYLLYLIAIGSLSQPSPVFPYGLADPPSVFQTLTLIARSLTLLMAAGTVFAISQAGRTLWNRHTGIFAAVNVMLLYPMFYYSRTGNFDVPYMFWAALGLWAYAGIVRQEFTIRRGLVLGSCAALAAGTKDQAASIFLLMPLVLIPLHIKRAGSTGTLWRRGNWVAPAMTVISGFLVYALSSGFVFRPERYFAHLSFITSRLSFPSYPATLEGYAGLLREIVHLLSDGMGAPMLVLASVGILAAALKDRLSLALLVPAAGVLGVFIAPVRFVEMRYLMPVMVVLACFAAYPVGKAIVCQQTWLRRTFLTIACTAWAVPALLGIELTYSMWHDARYAAAQWLNATVGPSEQIGFFSVGNHLPRIRADLSYVRVDRFQGTRQGVRYSKEDIENMGSLLLEKHPEFVLVIPDQSAVPGFPHGLTVPPELYRELEDGSLGYARAAHFHTPPLIPVLWRPDLVDYYEAVNPRVDIFVKISRDLAFSPIP